MNETDLHNMVASRLDAIEQTLQGMAGDLGALKAKMHLPATCELASKVNRLEMAEARRGGMLAVVGVLAGLVASSIVTIVAKLSIWR